MRLHSITSIADPLYDCWLDVYQRAFPLEQQLPVSVHNAALRPGGMGERHARYVVCISDNGAECLGMAHYEALPAQRVSALWYLAVCPDRRNRGIGGWMYDQIMRSIRSEWPECRACVIEVELPELCADADLALRRIRFYERCGATWLQDCTSRVDVGWQPPAVLGVMVHPFELLDDADMRASAACVLGEIGTRSAPPSHGGKPGAEA